MCISGWHFALLAFVHRKFSFFIRKRKREGPLFGSAHSQRFFLVPLWGGLEVKNDIADGEIIIIHRIVARRGAGIHLSIGSPCQITKVFCPDFKFAPLITW